eukprot:TRINITY_DN30849_c0_g1_i1.p1 TRINITY_DN30849_c0_g1~~TRINITY_DN30849_c0_g1_i1.p1  ORF type:complete len:179 (-),score=14.56 TRINITY_DN30849_c0_g1_i1:233-769(-)
MQRLDQQATTYAQEADGSQFQTDNKEIVGDLEEALATVDKWNVPSSVKGMTANVHRLLAEARRDWSVFERMVAESLVTEQEAATLREHLSQELATPLEELDELTEVAQEWDACVNAVQQKTSAKTKEVLAGLSAGEVDDLARYLFFNHTLEKLSVHESETAARVLVWANRYGYNSDSE